ncbi:hypothetical protein FE391_04680 [Nonomuraea sp. KC401]|uniref:hypothetical protein n=1 Tax=unclassified Nonomuraea TaxID=2593643 RepID=UPI0010FECFEE|nr:MULTISPECIES: hypothetical protein [unclassified Nonomuraea]NBE92887.1 hypothetical protein [Nonomuraea sp. K271]TLF83375.1 hypothetical protein FE391_04680 [Nonomuraea sp. KC401]
MILRVIAKSTVSLYPHAWRQRYGDEVADLVASRPVRVRTVLDLIGGAADAWLHHRRIPGRRPFRIPATAVLYVLGAALWFLWNPSTRDRQSLHRVWAEATDMGTLAQTLQGMATSLFVTAGVMGALAMTPVVLAARGAMDDPVHGLVTRERARRVVTTALSVAVPIVLLGHLSYATTSAGPLGDAMTGGFFVPGILALSLPVFTVAAEVPSLTSEAGTGAKVLAVAAIVTALAWLPVAALTLLGLAQAPWTFAAAVTVSALVSVCMAGLAARHALRRSRTVTSPLTAV